MEHIYETPQMEMQPKVEVEVEIEAYLRRKVERFSKTTEIRVRKSRSCLAKLNPDM